MLSIWFLSKPRRFVRLWTIQLNPCFMYMKAHTQWNRGSTYITTTYIITSIIHDSMRGHFMSMTLKDTLNNSKFFWSHWRRNFLYEIFLLNSRKWTKWIHASSFWVWKFSHILTHFRGKFFYEKWLQKLYLNEQFYFKVSLKIFLKIFRFFRFVATHITGMTRFSWEFGRPKHCLGANNSC